MVNKENGSRFSRVLWFKRFSIRCGVWIRTWVWPGIQLMALDSGNGFRIRNKISKEGLGKRSTEAGPPFEITKPMSSRQVLQIIGEPSAPRRISFAKIFCKTCKTFVISHLETASLEFC
jgi:hypothetical protein